MRKKLSLVLVVAMAALMTYGVVGSGAMFTAEGSASAVVTVGSMNLRLATDTGTVEPDGTVRCTAVAVMTATGSGAACDLAISIEGGIVPSLVTVTPSQQGAAEPDKFAVFNKAGASFPISGGHFVYIPTAQGQSLPIAEKFHLEWTDLGNPSMGNTISVTLSISAQQF